MSAHELSPGVEYSTPSLFLELCVPEIKKNRKCRAFFIDKIIARWTLAWFGGNRTNHKRG